MPRLGLRSKLVIGVLLLVLPLFGLLLGSVRVRYNQRLAGVLDDQVQTAETLAALVDGLLDGCLDLAWALARDPAVRSLDPTIADPHLQQLAVRYPEYLALIAYDARGNDVGTSVPYAPGEPRYNAARSRAFEQVMATGQAVVSEVHQAIRFHDKPVNAIAVPIQDGDRVIGATVLLLDPEQLTSRLARVRLQPGDAFFLLDTHGQVIFHSLRPNLGWEERDLSRVPEVQAALTGQTIRSSAVFSPLLKEQRVVAMVRSPERGWVAGMSSSPAVVFAPIDEAFFREIAIFSVLALVGLGGAWGLSIYLTQPLSRLAMLARAFGAGDLESRADVRTGDEVEDLGRAFNAMAAQLHQTLHELDAARQEAVRERDLVRAVFASLVDAVFVTEATGRLIDANPAALALSGLRREELGLPAVEMIERLDLRHPDGSGLQPEDLPAARALRGETFTDYLLWGRRPTGEARLISLSGGPVRDERGRVVFTVAVGRDVTESWREERERMALTRVAARIAETLDVDQVLATAVTELVASFDVALARVWLWDDAEQALILRASYGISPRTAATGSRYGRFQLGQLMIGTIAASRRPAWTNQLAEEPWLQEPDWARRERLVAFAGFPIVVADQLLGVMGLFRRHPIRERDLPALATISDQLALAVENARLYAEARQRTSDLEAERQRREVFVSAVAHDLRNLMTPLMVTVQLLPRWDQLPPERRASFLGQTISQTQRLNALVGDLLDVSRIEAGHFEIERQPADLAALARRIVEEQQATTTDHDLTFDGPDRLEGNWDPVRLAQVLTNLVNNAIKYSPEGGEVRVSIREQDRSVEVSVADPGLGLAPADIPLLFQPFARLERTQTLRGVGLGLHISQAIVLAHGGQIWAESPGPGRGSTFWIRLPR